MSGIVGIFHRDGAPIEPSLLQSLVDFLAYRGPDAHGSWMADFHWPGPYDAADDARVVWGVAARCLSRAGIGSQRTPGSTDAQSCWRHLIFRGSDIGHSVPDSELILRAYAKWGPACVEHLRGDFSFAIWDAPNKRLFCARDQFGIKPFYYASVGSTPDLQQHARLYPPASCRLWAIE